MRVLLSTIGSRGEVQPVVALASRLAAQGHQVRVCAPPDFRDRVESFGIPCTPIGPEVRSTATARPRAAPVPPTPGQLRELAAGTVATQFATVTAAAEGCDLVLGCGALQIAARSIAESRGIPYVYAAFCPTTLPSPHHAPPPLTLAPVDVDADNHTLWERDALRWNDSFGAALNEHRASAGLAPVTDVRSHVLTDRPLLAADPTLGPWPEPADVSVSQTGAWILPDRSALSPPVRAFLDAGEPPVYLGFGSMRAPRDAGRQVVLAARALGRRAIVSRGWAGLAPPDDGPDCLSVGDVNQQALFRRVAAVVHHGGAGTTTAAALAGVPQVVVPRMYDQFYWARRVRDLGIGNAHPAADPTADSLAAALRDVLRPEVAARAATVADAVRTDGVESAARRLTAEVVHVS
jgi:vancomycin aglycone glucosyltransferase